MKACPNCHTTLADEARFCSQCGAPQGVQSTTGSDHPIDWDQDVAAQIRTSFFAALQQSVQSEYGVTEHLPFSERVYETGFRDFVERRSRQVSEKLSTQLEMDAISIRTANKRIEVLLEELVDFFMIRHCSDLVPVPMPEAILRYQELSWEEIDPLQMILDYLDFAHEPEVVYTDFLIMPVNKLKNAGRSFLFPEKQEKIWLICDQSIFGSCKEGFALTENGVYWKAHLQKARQVAYRQLQQVEREKDWININTHFFNVSPSLNQKMLKLLKKLRQRPV